MVLLVVLPRIDMQGLHVSAVMANSRLCQEDLGKQIPRARLGCQDLTLWRTWMQSPIAVPQDFPETVAMHGDLHLIISNCMTSVPFWKAVVCSCCKSLPTNSKKHASFYLFVQQVLFSGCRSNVDLEKVWTQRLS